MSVFRVKLTASNQGLLDSNAVSTGTSIQRTVYVMGPHKTNRKLDDGDVFTDSNYWKRFTAAVAGADNAFIEVVSDDGSVYTDDSPVDATANAGTFPVVYDFTLTSGDTYAVNTAAGKVADFLGTYNSYADFCQITTSTNVCKCKINGSSSAIFDLSTSVVQVFNPGDIRITKLEFQNTSGGNSVVQIVAGVQVASNS